MASRRTTVMLLAGTIVCCASPGLAQTNLKLLSAWNPNNPIVPRIEAVFIKGVLDASNNELRIGRQGPEVVPTFEQFQPLSAGVFDLSYANLSYHQAITGVGSLMEATKADPAMRRSSGVFKWLDDYYRRRYGVMFLAIAPQLGFQYLLREPVGADGGLAGRKIRTVPILDGVTRSLGAVPINMAPQDIYASLQKGVIDGAGFPGYAVSGFKLQEVIRYVARPVIGQSNVAFMMNVKRFDSLPPNLQKVLIDEGIKIEKIGYQVSLDLEAVDREIFEKTGVKTTQFAPAVAAKLPRAYAEGIHSIAAKTTPADVEAFYQVARNANMLAE